MFVFFSFFLSFFHICISCE